MTERYSIVHIPRNDLIAITNGIPVVSSTPTEARYHVLDSASGGKCVGGPYFDKREANLAYDRLSSGIHILYLPNFNRLLMERSGAVIVESGTEVFVGLSRKQSERYARLHAGDVTDEFIELNLIHKRALSGIEDL